MKYILTFIFSFFVTDFYFSMMNFSFLWWLPLGCIALLLVYFNTDDSSYAYSTALCMGFLMDSHFSYLGIYTFLYIAIVFTLQRLQSTYFSKTGVLTTSALVALATLEYHLLALTAAGVVNGFNRYLVPTILFQYFITIVLTISLILFAQLCITISNEVRFNARKSF